MPAAMTIEMLPAAHGDSLLITCTSGTKVWRALVDTGTDDCWPTLRARLARIPVNKAGRRRLDLVVITHIDHDHIGAAKDLFTDRSLGLQFGDVWFNAPTPPAARGVAEGQALAELLGVSAKAFPWNRAWGGGHVVTKAEGGFVELPAKRGAPRTTLLSPSPKTLARLLKAWEAELKRFKGASGESVHSARSAPILDLAALAAKVTPVDRAVANGSSIAMLLEHRGVSLLLAADMHANVAVPALKALAAHRGTRAPMRLDAVKVSHHGSRGNVTHALMQAVQARHYLVSTNGAVFGHPDDEALARLIVNGAEAKTLLFNYSNSRNEKWANSALQKKHGYSARYPTSQNGGIRLDLG